MSSMALEGSSFSILGFASRLVLAFTLCFGFAATAVIANGAADDAAASADVIVGAIKGDVHMSMRGTERPVREGTVVELPATIRTGSNSSIELRQGPTTVKVAADSQIDIPVTAKPGDLLERIVQNRGNAFYSVGKRTVKKLRVETPYLVAVIKGTQFNVAVQDEMATISLYEGRLEVRAADESDVVDLNAGEIAIRHGGDKSIRILRMDNGQPVNRDHGNDRAAVPTTGTQDSAGTVPARSPVETAVADNLPIGVSGGVTPPTNGANGNAGGHAIETVNIEIDNPLDRSTPMVKADAAVGADVSVSDSSIAVGTTVDTTVGVGSASVDVGVGAAVDLGASGVSANVDTSIGVNAGAASVDLGAGAAVDVGTDGAALGVDTTVSTPVVDLGASIDTGSSGATASIDVGGALGVDLNVGTGAPVIDIVTPPTPTTGTGSDNGGLLGRVGRLLGRN